MVVCYDEIWMDENEAKNLASCLPTTIIGLLFFHGLKYQSHRQHSWYKIPVAGDQRVDCHWTRSVSDTVVSWINWIKVMKNPGKSLLLKVRYADRFYTD